MAELPPGAKLVYNDRQIQKQVGALAQNISPWVRGVRETTGRQVLGVCVLRGGVFFFADLLRAIPVTIEPTFCRAWSYASTSNEQYPTGVRVAVDQVSPEGRHLLLVDDICDTGATLKKLEQVFYDLGAKEVRTAVLIRRLVGNAHYKPAWNAFQYQGDDWFVGYGMEDKNHFSNLNNIYTIKTKSE